MINNTRPDESDDPRLHADAIALGIHCFDCFDGTRPCSYFTYRGVPGHLLPDILRDPRDLAAAAVDVRRASPELVRALSKQVIEVMVRLAPPGSYTAQAVQTLPITEEQYGDLLFIPLEHRGLVVIDMDWQEVGDV